jgi:uncharacterized membrane protein YesL
MPIVTIGSATVAAYSVTLKMVKDYEGKVVKQFIEAFKRDWKKGMPLGLIALGAAYFAYLNIEFFNKMNGNPIIFLLAAILIIFFSLVYLTYAFALCARYQNTVLNTLKNSAAITYKYFGKTLVLWFVVAVLAVLFMFNTTLLFFGLLIGPVSIFLTVSGFARKNFDELDKANIDK